MNRPLLRVESLSRNFGGLKAVESVDFEVFAGEIMGLLGPNGAGKTVCFNLISGVLKPGSGRIFLEDKRIDGLASHRIASLGIGRTFQIVKPLTSMTVLENVLVARGISRYSSFSRAWSPWKSDTEIRKAMETLERVGLADLAHRKAGLLPLGNLRRLEIARALVIGQKLLLLDESFSGLRHEEILRIEELIGSIRDDGVTVLLIEHNMRVTMGICSRIVVLDHGRKIAEGVPAQIRQNERVIEAYLGRKGERDAS